MSEAAWEAYLAERFPGYLLPGAQRRALPEDAAARFLERIGGRPEQVALLRAASVVAREGEPIRELTLERLPDLARRMAERSHEPRRSAEREAQAFEGRAPGRLDVAATLRCRLEGRSTRFVARAPARARGPEGDARPRPEDALVKATARRLRAVLVALETAGLLGAAGRAGARWGAGWGDAVAGCGAALDRLLAASPLAAIPDLPRAPVTAAHEQAALAAAHPAYPLAARIHRALREGLDRADPAAIARALSEGALAPLGAPTRFELAVLIRLLEALEQRLLGRAPKDWVVHRTAVLPGRREVAHLEGPGGRQLRVYYNQACLPPGPQERGARRYFGREARLRPDVVIEDEAPDRAPRATVIEVKLSSDPGYLVQGYQEALLYRLEYAARLTGWPKAILVVPGPVRADPCHDDEVVAVGWDRWVPEAILDGLVEGA